MKHEWVRYMIAQNEKDIATLIESIPEDLLNLINLNKTYYQLFSHEQHAVWNSDRKEIEAGWKCQKVKGANKCLSGLDDQGRVNATVRYEGCDCKDENEDLLWFCDKCTKVDLVIQLLRRINAERA